jgi:hypothetical protein
MYTRTSASLPSAPTRKKVLPRSISRGATSCAMVKGTPRVMSVPPMISMSSQGLSRGVLWVQLICRRIETLFGMTPA